MQNGGKENKSQLYGARFTRSRWLRRNHRVLRYTEDSVLLRRHDPALSHNDVVLREKTAFNVHAKEASASKRV